MQQPIRACALLAVMMLAGCQWVELLRAKVAPHGCASSGTEPGCQPEATCDSIPGCAGGAGPVGEAAIHASPLGPAPNPAWVLPRQPQMVAPDPEASGGWPPPDKR
jgi:hypothetical protein